MTDFYKNNGILKVILIFAEEGRFRSKRGFSQKNTIFAAHFVARFAMGVTVLRNGTRVPKSASQLQNTLRNGALAAKLGIFTLCSFTAISQL